MFSKLRFCKFPVCQAESRQHFFRARYFTKFFKKVHKQNPSALWLQKDCGSTIDEKKKNFVWFSTNWLPSSVAEIIVQGKCWFLNETKMYNRLNICLLNVFHLQRIKSRGTMTQSQRMTIIMIHMITTKMIPFSLEMCFFNFQIKIFWFSFKKINISTTRNKWLCCLL